MAMVKMRFCDRCGEVIAPREDEAIVVFQKRAGKQETFDFCEKCADVVLKQLRGESEGDEKCEN